MKKNDLLEIKIETMGNAGEGIGKIDGYPLFVKDALPGDTARVRLTKVKKTYAYARLEDLLEPSPYRTKPRCPLHRSCGGCQIQTFSYEKQLEYKENKVRQDLIRIGGFSDPPVLPVLGMEEPYHYRNKAQFPSEGIGRGASSPAFTRAAPTRLCRARTAPSACRKIKRSWRRFWTS